MVDLSTDYLGHRLKNPVIVASSTLVQNLEGIMEAQDAGAAAIVLRSLFEEIIRDELGQEDQKLYSGHPEEFDYVFSELSLQYGPKDYLELIRHAKSKVQIPVMASINCHTHKWWINYARQIEAAGADALELNLSLMPTDPGKSSLDIEQEFLQIVRTARQEINIPIAVKIGPYFTGLSRFANQMCGSGIDALVLFNRFYQFDLDIEQMSIKGANWYSTADEMSLPLRWIAVLYKHVNCDLVATTGIHHSPELIKQILAGATAVEIASTIYKNGFKVIQEILKGLTEWMEKKDYSSLQDFRGKLSLSSVKDPQMYERLQYIKALTGIDQEDA